MSESAAGKAELLQAVRRRLEQAPPDVLAIVEAAIGLFPDENEGWQLDVAAAGHVGTHGGQFELRVSRYLDPRPARQTQPAEDER